MSRLKADLILFLVAAIWGAAFLFQKQGVLALGACTFVALRFLISAVLVLPLACREFKTMPKISRALKRELLFLCVVFVVGVLFQHLGLVSTSVTNAGFLTGLYVLFVALICRFIYKQTVSKYLFPAALFSVVGIGLLSGGGDLSQMNWGDLLVILCAVSFGFQVALIGRIMNAVQAPYCVSFLQYAVTVIIAGVLAFVWEQPQLAEVWEMRWALLYAGALSGGVAYTLQVVAQQFTPASDSAVIMSMESVFAALVGVLINGDAFTVKVASGALMILVAIALVEFGPRAQIATKADLPIV